MKISEYVTDVTPRNPTQKWPSETGEYPEQATRGRPKQCEEHVANASKTLVDEGKVDIIKKIGDSSETRNTRGMTDAENKC